MNEASKRAAMPTGTNAVLDRRTVYHSNSNLLDIVKPGDSVLDAGCGSGTITAGIAALTGPDGHVTGIDTSPDLVDQAKRNFSHIDNIRFEVADINSYQPNSKFDVITAARVLQWVDNPVQVIIKMKKLLKPGGSLAILDYNHEKIQWEPEIPQSMQQFYNAFLKWRADAGMDNRIADHLENIFRQEGLLHISITDHPETSLKGSPEFEADLDIWAKVAETRGKQLLQDNYITDELRLAAIADYREWVRTAAHSMTLYLRAASGVTAG
jgi:ubiquinone/menaquinone biosynthesis C-methylase UbiE